jgi:glutamyl/glutaminyl-tRNA synthetase
MADHIRDLLRDAPVLRSVAARWHGRGDRPAPVTRFAPSPTGDLHLGHVAHALWVWGVADVLGAQVLLRMEDHDRSRCAPEFERGILRDLIWLGFAPEPDSLASLVSGDGSPFRQSDSAAVYDAALDRLCHAPAVYGCTCTRGMLGEPGPDGERRYPGTCRGQPCDRGTPGVLRAVLPDTPTSVEDLVLGSLVQHPLRDHGDVVIRDAQRQWTYQFCVVIDDMRHGVNLVVRGSDLVSSTGRQVLLGALLGREHPPVTVHHPLVLAHDGRKLSKRDRSETVAAMRAGGMRPADVLEAAFRVSGLDDSGSA